MGRRWRRYGCIMDDVKVGGVGADAGVVEGGRLGRRFHGLSVHGWAGVGRRRCNSGLMTTLRWSAMQ